MGRGEQVLRLAGSVSTVDPESLRGSDTFYMIVVLLVFGGFALFMYAQSESERPQDRARRRRFEEERPKKSEVDSQQRKSQAAKGRQSRSNQTRRQEQTAGETRRRAMERAQTAYLKDLKRRAKKGN